MKIKIITHYPKGNLGGDYTSIEIKVNGKTVRKYGDSYHDKGKEISEGFLDGLFFLTGDKLDVERVDIDDAPAWG